MEREGRQPTQPFEGKSDAGSQKDIIPKPTQTSFHEELSHIKKENLNRFSNPREELWWKLAGASARIEVDDVVSQEAAWKVNLAFYMIARPIGMQADPIEAAKFSIAPLMYDGFIREQTARGEQTDELVLNYEQAKTLKLVLDLVDIPFDVAEEKTHISIAPLAQEAAGTEFIQRAEKIYAEKQRQKKLDEIEGYITNTGALLKVVKNDEQPEKPFIDHKAIATILDLEAFQAENHFTKTGALLQVVKHEDDGKQASNLIIDFEAERKKRQS